MTAVNNIDYLNELFFRIKNLRHSTLLTDSILYDELTKWNIDPSYNNYHISYNCYDNYGIATLTSDDVSHTLKYIDDFTQNLVTNCNFIIIDKLTLKPIVSFFNKIYQGQNAVKLLKENTNWKNIEVTKYYFNSKHVCLFFYNNKTFLAHSKLIELIEPNTKITNYSNILQIFLMYLKDKQIVEIVDNLYINFNTNIKIDTSKSYHFLIKHNDFKKIHTHNKNDNGISLLCICDNECNIIPQINTMDNIMDNIIIKKIQYEKKIFFSCIDELLISLDLMNNEDFITKNIQYGGYYIKIYNENHTCFTSCFLNTEIYNYLLSIIPHHKNQYKNYLELYQHDKLTEILPYLHKYPADVVRRINMSVKILAKEILNIYHLTRKKQNCELYESLPIIYKKILYNLHKIYVNQKYGEFLIKKSSDDMKEKKSISVDIVYGYLKGMINNELIDLFENRKKLIEELKKIKLNIDDILSIDNIDIVTQTELMFA